MFEHLTRSDEVLARAVLAAALVRAGREGFTGTMLARAGRDAGLEAGAIARLFPQGPLSLIEFSSSQTDAEMQRRIASLDLPAMKVRTRISTAVLTRLAILKPHKDAARRAAAMLAFPANLPLAGKLVYATVDRMWRAAGDLSTDFNFYTKRAILAGVYSSTLMRWLDDTGPDDRETKRFLAARIENVMQYEKLKGQFRKEASKGFDRFSELLRAVRR